jgi:hypothetical protein
MLMEERNRKTNKTSRVAMRVEMNDMVFVFKAAYNEESKILKKKK